MYIDVASGARTITTASSVYIGFAAAAVVAAVLAIAALVARNDAADNAATAQQNEALANSRELAASAVAVLGEDPELSVLLAFEAIDANPPDAAVSGADVLVRISYRVAFRW